MWPIQEKDNRSMIVKDSLWQAAGMSRYGSLINIKPSARLYISLMTNSLA